MKEMQHIKQFQKIPTRWTQIDTISPGIFTAEPNLLYTLRND